MAAGPCRDAVLRLQHGRVGSPRPEKDAPKAGRCLAGLAGLRPVEWEGQLPPEGVLRLAGAGLRVELPLDRHPGADALPILAGLPQLADRAVKAGRELAVHPRDLRVGHYAIKPAGRFQVLVDRVGGLTLTLRMRMSGDSVEDVSIKAAGPKR